VIKIDRVYYSAMALPYDYGFIPSTLSEDGDPLDGIILLDAPSYPGILVVGRPIGVIYMVDSGEKDEKIVAVPADDPRYNHITSLDQLGEHFQKELTHYFEHYKDLQGKEVKIESWGDKAAALAVMKEAQANFK
jgi:inorganic pyrophosphatase